MPKNPEITATAVSDGVAERIRDLRRRRGLKVEQLAQAAAEAGHPELTRDAIYAIESGRRLEGRRRRTISVDELWAFAEVLKVPAEMLLTGSPLSSMPPLSFKSDEEAQAFLDKLSRAAAEVMRGVLSPEQEE